MCIHVGVPECPYCFGVTFTLTSGTSPILLAVRIPNLLCGYILGLQRVTHCLKITVTLTSGLIYVNLLSLGAFLSQLMSMPNNHLSNNAIQMYLYR